MSKEDIDITFERIVYPVKLNSTHSPILKSIDGKFNSGELTAIMGKSGAGKTTLLNILAGQISTNLEGAIRVNGTCLDYKEFQMVSSYVPQDVLLEPHLTVKEYMMVGADLMLSRNMTTQFKETIVLTILKSLGLQDSVDTRTEHLSGGERKRLSIALELIHDPKVILLDEPTSGLDNVAARNCIEVLKNLASKGKIVICSIHQPSDYILKMFDRVYFINDGNCIYDGTIPNLIPFLQTCGCPCPKTHSPADFILEFDDATYETLKLRTLSLNCNQTKYIYENELPEKRHGRRYRKNNLRWFDQTMVILRKNYLQQTRNRNTMIMFILQHLLCSSALGVIGLNNGYNAKRSFDNFKFVVAICIYFHFSYTLSAVVTAPIYLKVTKHHFRNGWYTPLSYLVAEIFTFLPSMITFSNIFSIITYSMFFAEIDFTRSLLVGVIITLTSFCANVFGLCIGVAFNVKNGCVVAPAMGAAGVVIAAAGLGDGMVHPIIRILRQLSFIRYAFVGTFLAFYDGRQTLECNEIFCIHANLQRYFKDMGLENTTYSNQVIVLSFLAILFVLIYYFVLRIRFYTDITSAMKRFRLKHNL